MVRRTRKIALPRCQRCCVRALVDGALLLLRAHVLQFCDTSSSELHRARCSRTSRSPRCNLVIAVTVAVLGARGVLPGLQPFHDETDHREGHVHFDTLHRVEDRVLLYLRHKP